MTKIGIALLALTLGAGTAAAQGTNNEDTQPKTQQPPAKDQTTNKTPAPSSPNATSPNGMSANKNTAKPASGKELDASQVMQLTQQAMSHIDAAAQALRDGKTAAAKSALARSKQVLAKLYNTPPVTAMLNEFDETINALNGKRPALEPLDLQPLRATVATYQEYVDPRVIAGVDEAQQKAKQGDVQGTRDALKLARDRVAIDMAFLPVEEAYTRVLAAQQALQDGQPKTALSMIRNVPIVVGQVQLSRPLLPISMDLQAAAAAADAQDWKRAGKLLDNANSQVKQLTSVANGGGLLSDLKPIANELQQLTEQIDKGTNPRPEQIRQIAQRTRSLSQSNQNQMQNQTKQSDQG